MICYCYSQDSTLVDPTIFTDQQEPEDSVYTMAKSPWTAVLLSAVIPGAGQIYNESYWKAPLILGLGYYLVDIWIFNNDNYWEYAKLYDGDQNDVYYRYREFYHNQRDQFAVYIGLTYLLNLVDAYVDAQLFDFDVSPDPVTFSPRLNLTIRF